MSLINDALKQARKSAPSNLPSTMPLLQPVAEDTSFMPAWFWPSLVILLVAAAIFFIGWAVARRSVRVVVMQPKAAVATPAVASTSVPSVKPQPATATAAPSVQPQPVAATSVPIVQPPPVAVATVAGVQPQPVAHTPPPTTPPAPPKLQGITYSRTAPTAIVDGKILHPGDQVGQYRVKLISKSSVTLIGPDKQEFQISMGK